MEVINRASKEGQERLSEIQKIEAEFINGAFWETVKCWVTIIIVSAIAMAAATFVEVKTREGHASYDACTEKLEVDQYCEVVIRYRQTERGSK